MTHVDFSPVHSAVVHGAGGGIVSDGHEIREIPVALHQSVDRLVSSAIKAHHLDAAHVSKQQELAGDWRKQSHHGE